MRSSNSAHILHRFLNTHLLIQFRRNTFPLHIKIGLFRKFGGFIQAYNIQISCLLCLLQRTKFLLNSFTCFFQIQYILNRMMIFLELFQDLIFTVRFCIVDNILRLEIILSFPRIQVIVRHFLNDFEINL